MFFLTDEKGSVLGQTVNTPPLYFCCNSEKKNIPRVNDDDGPADARIWGSFWSRVFLIFAKRPWHDAGERKFFAKVDLPHFFLSELFMI